MSTYYLDGRDLRELVKQVKTGDVIILYEGPYDEFEPDLFGVTIRIKDQFLRNGDRLICKCQSRFLEKDGISTFEYLCNGWFPDLMGNVIMKLDHPSENKPDGESEPTKSKLMRNGEFLVYDGVINGCAPSIQGIVINQDCGFSIVSWAGDEYPLYQGRYDDWRASQEGIIIRFGDEFWHNDKMIHDEKELRESQKCVYKGEWSNWDSGFSKLIIRLGNKFLRNGVKLIYEGEVDSHRAHPNGLLIVKDNKFSLIVYKDNKNDPVREAVISLVTEVMGNEGECLDVIPEYFPEPGRADSHFYFSGRRRPN